MFVGENAQLLDLIFFVEKFKRHQDTITTIILRGRIGETKDFAFYMNEFLKDLTNLKALWIMKTNLGGLMRGCKNVNMFRELRTTKLTYVNLTSKIQ